MSDKQTNGNSMGRLLAVLAIGLLAIIAYQVVSGGFIKKLRISKEEVEIDFHGKKEQPQTQNPQNQTTPNTATNENVIPTVKPQKPTQRFTTVYLAYAGDQYGCSLPITITIGDQMVMPQGNLFPVENVALGSQDYSIYGQIHCPGIGSCEVDGDGVVNVQPERTFNIIWQNVDFGYCSAFLQ